jgi:hypothetical protein
MGYPEEALGDQLILPNRREESRLDFFITRVLNGET